VVVLDNLVYGHRDLVSDVLKVPLVEGQIGNLTLLDQVLVGSHPAVAGTPLEGRPIEAVLHFAAYAYVGESVSEPAKYYRNNLGDTLVLLEALRQESQRRGTAIPLVFSSTCATYGIPSAEHIPIRETTPQQPINPYGRSKWMVEQLLADFGAAYGQPSVIFRYFNAAGADPAGDQGAYTAVVTYRGAIGASEPASIALLGIAGLGLLAEGGAVVTRQLQRRRLAEHVRQRQHQGHQHDDGDQPDPPGRIRMHAGIPLSLRRS
jgi:UDP-glucose 4-epimerase